MKRPRCLHTAEVAGSIPASPTLSVFYLQNEQQESNLEDLPLFRRKLTLLDDILADLTAGCVDIDPHTPCIHDRSIRLFGGTARTHHAIRVNLTEIRCRSALATVVGGGCHVDGCWLRCTVGVES